MAAPQPIDFSTESAMDHVEMEAEIICGQP
jgi:hypothetical protein